MLSVNIGVLLFDRHVKRNKISGEIPRALGLDQNQLSGLIPEKLAIIKILVS